jgi:hypothetical protein
MKKLFLFCSLTILFSCHKDNPLCYDCITKLITTKEVIENNVVCNDDPLAVMETAKGFNGFTGTKETECQSRDGHVWFGTKEAPGS